MKVTIDRIEGEYAVCELPDGTMKDVLLSELPDSAKEGSVIEISDSAPVLSENDETDKRKKNFARLN
ncbi:MAG: DUF3006 domain-containing protein, partial [Clostridia bacterium]|nr:DUF3006 domain-containing protein [Clostridia bacterium]